MSQAHSKRPHFGRDVVWRSGASGLRAGIRVADRCRDRTYPKAATQPQELPQQGELLGSGDEEDLQFLEALKGLVNGAVKLLGADKGMGAWLMSGLLRKSGVIDSFVDSMVVFMNRRIGALLEVLSPKDAACAFARRLRQHVRAHDATTGALGIRAGRKKRSPKRGTSCTDPNVEGEEEGGEKAAAAGGEDGELEEHHVQAVQLWRQWKRAGGFWPPQMPDPDDTAFDGPDGTKDFLEKLDDGTQLFLRDVSRSILETALPEEADDLQAACEAAATRSGGGTGGDSSRSIMETANRLAQLKSGVLEPMLCQVLTQQVVGLWQFVLQLLRPGTNLNPAARDMKHPEAFSLMAGALERSGSTSTGTLRMELMQGLVKMAWSSRGDLTPRGAPASSGAPGAQQPGGDRSGEIKTPGSAAAARNRTLSIDSSRWSEADFGSESADGDVGLPSPRESAPPAPLTRSKSGGARDIFNMPYTEQLSHGLVGGEKDKFYEDLEEHALDELAKFLQSEIVEKLPLASLLLQGDWIPDRVNAARAFARRPTNLMLMLSIIDALKSVVGAAGDKDKRKASSAANSGASAARAGAALSGGESEAESKDGGTSETPGDRGQAAEAPEGDGSAMLETSSQGGERRSLWGRRRGGSRRDTPGWRAWEARRTCFFGMDLGVAALHFGRSLLGQEALDLGDAFLRSVSLEYCSLENVVRVQAADALRKCSGMAAQDMLRKAKPLSTQPILYVSTQMRVLRALKKTGLDFSKSLGDGPQKKALSRRFRSYSWIFTDALIDKLVALRTEDAARSRVSGVESTTADSLVSERAQAGDGLSLEPESRKGATRAESEPRRLELKRERRRCKSEVMREMTADCGSSKDLLAKIVGSWLPEVLAADKMAEDSST